MAETDTTLAHHYVTIGSTVIMLCSGLLSTAWPSKWWRHVSSQLLEEETEVIRTGVRERTNNVEYGKGSSYKIRLRELVCWIALDPILVVSLWRQSYYKY